MARATVTYSGPQSRRSRRRARLRYRFAPPRNAQLNLAQRLIWRVQRLVLGDNRRRRQTRDSRTR
ncbi:MAG: hypothetical protein ACYDEH_07110 [Acidimicrobiales bacterium]